MALIEDRSPRESVWEYPRPPRVEDVTARIRVLVGAAVVADSTRAKRVLETSHPPSIYIPREDVVGKYLRSSLKSTFCEWKGRASYCSLRVDGRVVENAAWYYPESAEPYLEMRNYLAFYPSVDVRCYIDDEQVAAEAGSFYGGWVSRNIEGLDHTG